MAQRISSGSSFEEEIGYSRAVVDGGFVFVSGTTGYDYDTMTICGDVVAQAAQCCANIAATLAHAGSSMDDVVRVMYVFPHTEDFRKCWPTLRRAFATARPAAPYVRADLLDPQMLIEIEVTARARSAGAESDPASMRHVRPADVETTVSLYCLAWGEPDVERRRELLQRSWTDEGLYVDAGICVRGRDALVEHIGRILARRPGARIRRTDAAEEHHDAIRFAWSLVTKDDVPLRSGTDFGERSSDGRLSRIVGFLDVRAPDAFWGLRNSG